MSFYPKMKRRLLIAVVFSLLIATSLRSAFGQSTVEQRPANFIFLIDVSGSMVSKKTMIKNADGSESTLFEALRQALKQIVADERLLSADSKVKFVTFGTSITEKEDWPQTLRAENRTILASKISSTAELQADKHGDTYMGGALEKAIQKANELASSSEPCTTTFIVMLTDGWDEPPPGATIKVRDVAGRLLAKQNELRSKLGVNTWQVRVIGLQRLPDRKAGTTTAAELAGLIGGEFLDITKQNVGSVPQRIYSALKKTISDLQGKVALASPAEGGVADFGTISGITPASANVKVSSRSCYGEQIIAIEDVTAKLTPAQRDAIRKQLESMRGLGQLKDNAAFKEPTFSEALPKDALRLSLLNEVHLIPIMDQLGKDVAKWQSVPVLATVRANCPPGTYIGAARLQSTARFDDLVPYFLSVPSRIVTNSDTVTTKIRKPGFFWTEPSKANLTFAVGTSLAGHQMGETEIIVEPQDGKTTSGDMLGKALINDGKPATIKLNMNEKANQPVKLAVDIPADLKPGTYTGVLQLKMPSAINVVAPADLTYKLDVEPSAWEQVSPVAVPLLTLLTLVLIIWFSIWIAGFKRG